MLKDHVPRVDKEMDNATKSQTSKRKQSLPRVAKQKRSITKSKTTAPTSEPIAQRTRAKKTRSEPVASRTRSKKAERRGQRAAKRIAAAVQVVPSERDEKQRSR